MSGDLVAFLRARLDEDEKWAQTRNAGLRARWPTDPARALREVEAKRAIIGDDRHDGFELYAVTERGTWPEELTRAADEALRLLAAVYRDHPDYRQEWAP